MEGPLKHECSPPYHAYIMHLNANLGINDTDNANHDYAIDVKCKIFLECLKSQISIWR